MSGSIVPHRVFSKYNVTTGAGTYNLPREDMSQLYGPGWPIAPVTRPEDTEVPRTIDYPVAINATLQPRIGYRGLMPINALMAAYENVTETSLPVNLIIRELSSFVPMLRYKANKQRVPDDHEFNWMTISPDRKVPFNVWMARYKKSAKIYAAPAFFKHRGSDGVIDAMQYIDGSTLFLIVNARGDLPEPDEVDPEIQKFLQRIRYGMSHNDLERAGIPAELPTLPYQKFSDSGVPIYAKDYLRLAKQRAQDGKPLPMTTPAFTQIIKGIPFSFWDKSQVYFIPEPPSPTVNSPYGETFIERSWTWISIIAVMTAFELGHYRTGNMPEGFATMPKDWFPTMARLASAEREFNNRMAEGTQTQHSRIRFGPEGMKWIPTKKPDFPRDLYKQAKDNILYSIGVPSSEVGEKPSQGLGGKGFEKGAGHDVTRQILEAEKAGLENAFNRVLIDSDVSDVEFYMDYPQEEIDPAQQQEDLWNKFIHGVNTLNDCLTAQDKQPIGDKDDKDNIANMHLIVSGSSIFVVEKMDINAQGLAAPYNAQPGQAGGPPVGPEDAALQDQGQHGPDDKAQAQQIARRIEDAIGKSFSGKTVFVMPGLSKQDDGTLPTLAGSVSLELAAQIYTAVVPSDNTIDADLIEQFRQGLEEEQEHADTVGNDTRIIASIVLDHLREDSQYYVHLREAMGKRYRVVGTGPFRVMNIDTGEMVPGGEHKTKPEADAHARALWANVPDAHKLRKADITSHDGAMVAVFIPAGVAKQLRQIADGLGLPATAEQELADNMHVTLAFLPDVGNAARDSEKIMKVVEEVAVSYGPIEGKIEGFGVFNGEAGKHVLYATLDCPDLPFIRTQICEGLYNAWVEYGTDHGFVPHITLAYFPDNFELPAGFKVPDIAVKIDGLTLAIGERLTTIRFRWGNRRLGKNLVKVNWAEYFKHCGLCPEDDAYFGAPISRELQFDFPDSYHVNEVEIVAMTPAALPPQPALWKPEGGENVSIQEKIGGPQYVREEAAWLLDQCLGFHMVPLAYVTEADGERGAAIWYTAGQTQPRPVADYDPVWIERAAVLDYIMSQQDRGNNHNYFTHPDDPNRIVLIDNGFSFPGDPTIYCESIFCETMIGKPLSDETLRALQLCLGDVPMWQDIQDVLSEGGNADNAQAAVAKAKICAQRLLDEKMITAEGYGKGLSRGVK